MNLSPRELEVVALVVKGFDNRRIGQRLGVTIHTVKHHLTSIGRKLDVTGRVLIAVESVRRGLA